MRIFHGLDSLPQFQHPAATVGSYDGVHGGHMELLQRVTQVANELGGESIVMTFNPHPRITLGHAEGLRLLTTIEEKVLLFEQAGVDNLIVIPFDQAFSCLTPYEFVRHYLIGRIGVEALIVGYNHHFGHDKGGNYDYLDYLHGELGFRVERISEYDQGEQKISSTVIRRLIGEGQMQRAAALMHHPYTIMCEVSDGKIRIPEPLKLIPPVGEYDVLVGGIAARLTIDTTGALTLDRDMPAGDITITF